MHLRAADLVVVTIMSGRFDALDYLEAQVGRVAFVVPKITGDVSSVAAQLGLVMDEFGKLLREIADATCISSDSGTKISPAEWKRIELECDRLQKEIMRLREAARIEAGV